MRPSPLLVFLAIAALTMPATAHVENFSEAKSVDAGPYTIFLDPQPSPLYSGTTLTFSTIITQKSTGAFARDIDVVLNVTNPNGVTREAKLKPDGSNYYLGAILVDVRGNHTARLTLTDAAGTYVATTWFEVYPDLVYRVSPGDAALDAYTGETSKVAFKITSRQPNTDDSGVTDLTVRVEHWSDDHRTLVGADNVPAKKENGVWVISYVFPERGMYHMTFSSQSGGFTYPDIPLLHMYATANTAPPSEEKATPPASLAALLGLIACVALLRPRK